MMGNRESAPGVPASPASASARMRAWGIDLGTTNSSIAEVVLLPGAPAATRVLELEQPTREGVYSSPLIPSVVAILPDGRTWVGEGAKRLRAFPQDYGLAVEKTLFYDTKNEMGLRKTYFRAPESFNHASKIGGKILEFIARQAAAQARGAALPLPCGSTPEDLISPAKEEGSVLSGSGGSEKSPRESALPAHISVTVPASFQLNQRRDTLLAARFAGLDLADDDLLDEPTAALIDYFVSAGLIPELTSPLLAHPDPASGPARASDAPFAFPAGRPAVCVVFDFGGGTCDVSVIEISKESGEAAPPFGQPREGDKPTLGSLNISHLSVSRYHRLGGGDIDAAIVHEVLIPRLLAENSLDPLALSFGQKKKGLEPQLLSKAEALKIALCSEINRLIKFGRYPTAPISPTFPASSASPASPVSPASPSSSAEKSRIIVRQPSITCTLGASAAYTLSEPSLSASEFERILAPFLDTDFLFARTTDYRLTQSIFAPLRDAMDRSGRDAADVDFCLMVGGSSLIPQVRSALRAFFPGANVRFYEDGLDAKLCVSRGAAWNAAYKAVAGKPLIRPVLQDGITLVAHDGRLNPLICSGTESPFPGDGSYLAERLRVPPSAVPPVREIRFEIIGERDRQRVFDQVWDLPPGVSPGDEIVMEYRLTAGMQLDCRASLAADPSAFLQMTTVNPLVNVLNPNATQVEIEEIEEDLRQRQGGTARDRDTYIKLARLYAEINQREKALDYLRTAQSRISRPDPGILNLQGIYFDELGDYDRAEKAYFEADKAAPSWGGPLFNLALSFRRRDMHEEAVETLEMAIRKSDDPGPYLGLKALCLESLGESEKSQAVAAQAVRAFGPPAALDDWRLGWLLTAAQVAGDDDARRRAESEQKNRSGLSKTKSSLDGVLRPAVMDDTKSAKGKSGPSDGTDPQQKPPSKPPRKKGGKSSS